MTVLHNPMQILHYTPSYNQAVNYTLSYNPLCHDDDGMVRSKVILLSYK